MTDFIEKLKDQDTTITRTGNYDFDTCFMPHRGLTVSAIGNYDGCTVQILSITGGRPAPVADGGPFADDILDGFEEVISIVNVPGRYDQIRIVVKGDGNPNIRLAVR